MTYQQLHLPGEVSPDIAKGILTMRIVLNLAQTGHPTHHRTADGTIVEPDPTLEALRALVSPKEMPPIPLPLTDALPAVPVIRDWYAREPGRAWLGRWVAGAKRGAEQRAATVPANNSQRAQECDNVCGSRV
jgi:hypothetical protein